LSGTDEDRHFAPRGLGQLMILFLNLGTPVHIWNGPSWEIQMRVASHGKLDGLTSRDSGLHVGENKWNKRNHVAFSSKDWSWLSQLLRPPARTEGEAPYWWVLESERVCSLIRSPHAEGVARHSKCEMRVFLYVVQW